MPNQLPSTIAPAGTKWDTASAGRDGQPNIETATVNGTQYWRSDNGAASKVLNQQPGAARGLPTAQQLADWRMRQDAVNQYGGVGGYRNVRDNFYAVRGNNGGGYVIQGSEADAARFGAPVFNSAHLVQDGPNETFLRYRAEERARRARPEKPQMDMTLPGNSRRAKYHEQMQAYNNELNQGFGLDAKQMENALQRQRLAQEYGLGLGQLANSNAQTQAALGLNFLQQQQTQQQMRQQQMLDNARYTLATADPNSDAYKRAERVAKAYGDGGKNGGGPKIRERSVTRDDGTVVNELYTDYGDGTWGPAQQRGTDGGANFADILDSFEAGLPQNQKDDLNELRKKDPNKYQTKRLELYAAANGVDYGA